MELFVAILNFLLVEPSITVFVERFKHGSELLLLGLSDELRGHVSKSSLLEDLVGSEVLKVA